jgi:hypothetical protein
VLDGRVGIKVICKKDGNDTNFRLIIKPFDLEGLCGSLARICRRHNMQEFLLSTMLGSEDRGGNGGMATNNGSVTGSKAGSAISAFRAMYAIRANWNMQRLVEKGDRHMMRLATIGRYAYRTVRVCKCCREHKVQCTVLSRV